MSKENPSCLTKLEVTDFQHRTIDRIANYIYELEDSLGDVGTDLAETKKETALTRTAIEVELEGLVAIIEEYHGL